MTSTTDRPPRRAPAPTSTAIADDYFDAAVALSPINATYLGIPGHEEDLDDFSPAGHAAQLELRRAHAGRAGRRRRRSTTSTG